jgi:hypothetical protein
MLLNKTNEQMAKKYANESVTIPAYFQLGTGTTEATINDTALETRSDTLDVVTTRTNKSILIEAEKFSNSSATYTECGLSDAISSGNLYTRDVFSTVNHAANKWTRFKKLLYVKNESNSTNDNLTLKGVTDILDWFTGTDFIAPTHIAFSTWLVLDRCEELGSAPNAWTDSTDASAAALETNNFVEGLNAIKLGKSGSTVTDFSYERTEASTVDTTGYTNLQLRLNIITAADLAKLTTSNCLTIYIGSDSSNYKEISFDLSDLIVGWQVLDITISDMSDTGSPDMSAIDYLKIEFNVNNTSDTITSGNILMDYWYFTKELDEDDTVLPNEITRQAFETDYPSRTGKQVAYKSKVTKATGNTYVYNLGGLFNAASGGDMSYENRTNDIVKNSKTQIIKEITFNFRLGDT